MDLTKLISIGDAGLGDKIKELFVALIQFIGNVLYSIVSFGIDLLSDPKIGGIIVAIAFLYFLKRRSKRANVL